MIPSRRLSPDLPEELPPNLKYLLSLSPSAMTLGLSNIHDLLNRLDHPERRFRTVVVGGTNGKGSVTAMVASVLRAEGVRTGRYTSPHLYSVTERIQVDGQPVSIAEMEAAAERVAPHFGAIGFSYFEAITAIAFLIFAERGVDVAVLEVGLGGRFDATNVTTPEVCVIASISLDHRRLLGDTHEEILLEKLGIARPGVPLLIGDLGRELRCVVDERARREGFPVSAWDELGSLTEVTIPFPGPHQRINALLAVGAAERVLGRPLTAAGNGIADAYIPGRFERVESGGRTFILDMAHNDAALVAGARQLRDFAERGDVAIVFGLLSRKELFDAPRCMVGAASRLYLVSPSVPGGDPAHAPHELVSRYFPLRLTDRPLDVILWNRVSESDEPWSRLMRHLRGPANPYRVVLITGSHHTVERFGRLLQEGA